MVGPVKVRKQGGNENNVGYPATERGKTAACL